MSSQSARSMKFLSSLLFCALALTARAQLVRQANTTLTLPQTLPSATGYAVENAIGTLTFVNPI